MAQLNKIALIAALLAHSSVLWAQTCKENTKVTTPSSDFTVHNNGTVTHSSTGLMWKVCSEGQTFSDGDCFGEKTVHNWSSALNLAYSADFAGYADWRLPNNKELISIVELSCFYPAINSDVFPLQPPLLWYWSSSPFATSSIYAWRVDFTGGSAGRDYKRNQGSVRLVRNR